MKAEINYGDRKRLRSKSKSRRRPAVRARPLRILTAVPICDGHDSAIITINLELARHGIQVIYLGYHRSVKDIVRAAIQEDVQAIGLSSYNGGHVEFFGDVMKGLRRAGARDIGLFGGGGGTITHEDARQMMRDGAQRIFFAGTPLAEMVAWVKQTYLKPGKFVVRPGGKSKPRPDGHLSKLLSAAGAGYPHTPRATNHACPIIGITGPGGAGKTTLIDELALRFLKARPHGRLAILSHDPGALGRGAFLGDRATMVYAQHDRVFLRSLATTGGAGGLSATTRASLACLRHAGFDLVFVESAGIGQDNRPFARGLVNRQILVMSPDYGARLQLQKIAMLETADIVVANKFDRPGAKTALAEIQQRLEMNGRGQKLLATVAKRHADPGVDKLFQELLP